MFAASSGYRNDGDAGLMHVGARYYDSQVGRFITRDTDLGEDAYLYCDHNPVNATDLCAIDPPQTSKITPPVDPIQVYRPWWPKNIPIDVGPIKISGGGNLKGGPGGINVKVEGGGPHTVNIDGPAYWNVLQPATRAKLNTFGKLQQYCQNKEGARN
jgi:RHS repeat-associated protein